MKWVRRIRKVIEKQDKFGKMPHEHFCLKWNNYQSNIVQALGNLKLDEDFVDVTISVQGQKIKAHKVILSACSDYFRDVFRVSNNNFSDPLGSM